MHVLYAEANWPVRLSIRWTLWAIWTPLAWNWKCCLFGMGFEWRIRACSHRYQHRCGNEEWNCEEYVIRNLLAGMGGHVPRRRVGEALHLRALCRLLSRHENVFNGRRRKVLHACANDVHECHCGFLGLHIAGEKSHLTKTD